MLTVKREILKGHLKIHVKVYRHIFTKFILGRMKKSVFYVPHRDFVILYTTSENMPLLKFFFVLKETYYILYSISDHSRFSDSRYLIFSTIGLRLSNTLI